MPGFALTGLSATRPYWQSVGTQQSCNAGGIIHGAGHPMERFTDVCTPSWCIAVRCKNGRSYVVSCFFYCLICLLCSCE